MAAQAGGGADLGGGGSSASAAVTCEEKERDRGPGLRLYRRAGRLRGVEEGQRRGGGGSPARAWAAAAIPWRRRTPPESGTGAGALGRGLAGAGPAQSAESGRERESTAGLRPSTVRRVVFLEHRQTKIKQKKIEAKYNIGILYIKISRKRFSTT